MTPTSLLDATKEYAPIEARMAFVKPSDVHPDLERPGRLRVATRPVGGDPRDVSEIQRCRLWDWSNPAAPMLDLERVGFDSIDLSRLERLQATLEGIRRAGHVTRAEASVIRGQLRGRSFELSSGKRLRLLFIAPEDFIMRKAGPNGLEINPDIQMSEMNDHDGALTVHAD